MFTTILRIGRALRPKRRTFPTLVWGLDVPDNGPVVITREIRALLTRAASDVVQERWEAHRVLNAAARLQDWLTRASDQGELRLRVEALRQAHLNHMPYESPPCGTEELLAHAEEIHAFIRGRHW